MTVHQLFPTQILPVLQNRVYADPETARTSPTGEVRLVQDRATGLVYNANFDQSLMVYDEDYQNEQACSPTFARHLEDVMELARRHFKGMRILEVGCGKGHFLERMRDDGFAATGIDPAYEGDNDYVVKAAFERGIGVSGDAIVLRHVLEHIPQPVEFLAALAHANGDRGLIYIEVPCLDWILKNRAWFDIYYEHVNYFRLQDFKSMFGTVIESGHLFGGQYIYCVADLAKLRTPRAIAADYVELPEDFFDGIDLTRGILEGWEGARAIWGGASKGVIFSNYMSRHGVDFDAVIDINPAKQDGFIAVTALPVISPERAMQTLEQGAAVVVMNPNYFDEITAQSNNRFNYIKV